MKSGFVAVAILASACVGCSDAAKAKADADAARTAQAKAEAELAEAKAELAKARAGNVESPAKSELVAPRPLAPADGSELSEFPRKTTVRWVPVAGAATYKVEVEYEDPDMRWLPNGVVKESKLPEYQFEFVGAQPGRWRVWAVDPSGHDGPKSDWWTFRYTK